ncbi:MAG: SIS domain-containing protein [Candidatus Hydrogenedentes bacterium]|nr:SIS domain-containing protein [Candidatus Hydrogenedentota bacterium]
MSYVQPVNDYLAGLVRVLENLDRDQISNFCALLDSARDESRQIFIFGNGGSGANASHITGDLVKGASYKRDKRFRMMCLNDNDAAVLAYANDVGYDDVFVEQLKNFFNPGDVVIGISGSGNSENILRAMKFANEHGAETVGFCGYPGGKLESVVKHVVHANIRDMQWAEDVHLIVGHIAMKCLGGACY